MGAEGTTNLLPGALLKRPLSEGPKNYFRNVEAEGSSPFTSTKGQVSGLKWDPPEVTRPPRALHGTA